MKKAIAILIAVVMLLSCLGVAAVNAAVATVPGSVTLENSDIVYTADKGDTITYRVYITTPEIAENGQFYITYPESLIKVNSHSIPNTPGYMINYTSNLTDEIRFNFSNTNGCDLTSEKLLIELKFDVVGEGHGSIAFYSQVVSNLNDQSILKQTKFRETIEDADVFIPTELPTEPDTTDETNITEPTSDSSQPTTESDPDNTTDTTETDDTTTPTNTDETAEPTTESNESTTTGQDEPTTTESEEPGITQTPETTGPDKPTTTEPVTEPQEITEPSTPAPTTPAPKPTNPPSSKPNATQPV
ncbi:MAG: hypothetical protein J1E96_07535, partial [Ruminococcus sp.]|nr:hypothetical protein [Ruminococcus sp.]